MTYLILSLVALMIGPLLHVVARRASWALSALDGFVLTAVCGIVLLHIWPHSVHLGGWLALVGAAAGVVLPTLLERWRATNRFASRATLVLALFAIAVHGLVDGIGLSSPAEGTPQNSSLLALAVVLHRIPVGLAIWWILRPRHGLLAAAGMVAVIAATTLGGYGLGAAEVRGLPVQVVAVIQAFVAGALVHIVLEQAPGVGKPGRWAIPSAAGALAAVGLLFVLGEQHPVGVFAVDVGAAQAFLAMALQVAPVLVIGLAVASLLATRLPPDPAGWCDRGPAALRPLRAILLGILWPRPALEVLQRCRAMMRGATRGSAVIGLIVARSSMGLMAILVTLALLGGPLAIARFAGAGVLTVLLMSLSRFWPNPASGAQETRVPAFAQVRPTAFDAVENALPPLALGLILAAFVEPLVGDGWGRGVPVGVQIPVATLLAIPLYVRASGVTPMIAVLLHKGLSPAAGVAFLIAGPVVHLQMLNIIREAWGRRAALSFSVMAAAVAIGVGFVLHGIAPSLPPAALRVVPTEPVGIACLCAIGALLLVTLFRRGPRGLVHRVFQVGDGDG